MVVKWVRDEKRAWGEGWGAWDHSRHIFIHQKGLLIDSPLPCTRLVCKTRSDGWESGGMEEPKEDTICGCLGDRWEVLEGGMEGDFLPSPVTQAGTLQGSGPLTQQLHSHTSRVGTHTQVCKLSSCLADMALWVFRGHVYMFSFTVHDQKPYCLFLLVANITTYNSCQLEVICKMLFNKAKELNHI